MINPNPYFSARGMKCLVLIAAVCLLLSGCATNHRLFVPYEGNDGLPGVVGKTFLNAGFACFYAATFAVVVLCMLNQKSEDQSTWRDRSH